jgi:hypothetical protein
MPLYRHADKLVLFIHIPKTGGSTVEQVLHRAGAKQALVRSGPHGYSKSSPQHMHWGISKIWLPEDFYDYSFTLVRNPFSRLVSQYRWSEKLFKTQLPVFDRWVNEKFDKYAKNPYVNDNHLRPQTKFIGPNVELFRLEDGLEAPIFTALGKLGLGSEGVVIHHANKSNHQPVTVTERTFERVREFYAEDFKGFSYDPGILPEGLDCVVRDDCAGSRRSRFFLVRLVLRNIRLWSRGVQRS